MSILDENSKQLIMREYEYGNFDNLALQIGKSKHAISEWARRHGLKRKINVRRNGDMTPLISNTLISYYWLGFIAADGYISKNGHFMISQSEKDKQQIEKLSKYLNTSIYLLNNKMLSKSSFKNAKNSYRINIYDREIGGIIRQMFGLGPNDQKTYTSISNSFIPKGNKAKAFLIGYLDGDGSMYSCSCNVECYISWLPFLQGLMKKIGKKWDGHYKIIIRYKKSQNKHYCFFKIYSKLSRYLKEFAENNNLPFNDKKWSNIIDV